jgi:(p)ppGpp synthase/HD superfamily hydrolase
MEPALAHLIEGTDWPAPDRAAAAAALAEDLYEGHVRDNGRPYLDHPVAVALILRDQARLRDPEVLLCALLHDVFEFHPHATGRITQLMGTDFCALLEAQSPDHQLAGRKPDDADRRAWQAKLAAMAPELFAIRLADRLDNLRGLPEAAPHRRSRLMESLTGLVLPLAERRADESDPIEALAALLATDLGKAEYEAEADA